MTPENQLEVAKFGLNKIEEICEGWIKMNEEAGKQNTQTEAILEMIRAIQSNMR